MEKMRIASLSGLALSVLVFALPLPRADPGFQVVLLALQHDA